MYTALPRLAESAGYGAEADSVGRMKAASEKREFKGLVVWITPYVGEPILVIWTDYGGDVRILTLLCTWFDPALRTPDQSLKGFVNNLVDDYLVQTWKGESS